MQLSTEEWSAALVSGVLLVMLAAMWFLPARVDLNIRDGALIVRPRGVDRAAARLPEGADAVLAEALRLRDEEIESSAGQARLGADLVTELCGRSARLLTHCNTGALEIGRAHV